MEKEPMEGLSARWELLNETENGAAMGDGLAPPVPGAAKAAEVPVATSDAVPWTPSKHDTGDSTGDVALDVVASPPVSPFKGTALASTTASVAPGVAATPVLAAVGPVSVVVPALARESVAAGGMGLGLVGDDAAAPGPPVPVGAAEEEEEDAAAPWFGSAPEV